LGQKRRGSGEGENGEFGAHKCLSGGFDAGRKGWLPGLRYG
jgi:hypothetical protein